MTGSYRWVILALTVVAFMQTHVHRLAFAPLIPMFVADMGLGYAAAGTIQTAYFWTYMTAQLPIGLATDRWGARRVMLTCFAVLIVGGAAFAASGSYVASIGARMLVGLGAAAVWVPGMRLMAEWFPAAERGRATGMMSAGGGIGGTVGLMLVPWLATFWGWRLAYGVLVVPAVLTFVLIAVFLRGGDATPAAAARPGSLRRVLASRDLWPFNLAVIFSYGAYFSFITFLPAHLVKSLGYSATEAGLLTGLITAGTIISWPAAGALSDRLGRRKALFVASQGLSALLPLAFAFVAPHVGTAATMVIAFVSGLLVGGLILPFVMIVELFPREDAATASGVANSACFVGGIVLPIVFGRIVDVTGSFTIAFVVAATLQVIAFGFALGVKDATRSCAW